MKHIVSNQKNGCRKSNVVAQFALDVLEEDQCLKLLIYRLLTTSRLTQIVQAVCFQIDHRL